MSCAIRVEGLQKSYAGRAVLKGLTFTVEQGEIFALLGVNGAGKTTLLKCMLGLLEWKTGGTYIDGANIKEIPCHPLLHTAQRIWCSLEEMPIWVHLDSQKRRIWTLPLPVWKR